MTTTSIKSLFFAAPRARKVAVARTLSDAQLQDFIKSFGRKTTAYAVLTREAGRRVAAQATNH